MPQQHAESVWGHKTHRLRLSPWLSWSARHRRSNLLRKHLLSHRPGSVHELPAQHAVPTRFHFSGCVHPRRRGLRSPRRTCRVLSSRLLLPSRVAEPAPVPVLYKLDSWLGSAHRLPGKPQIAPSPCQRAELIVSLMMWLRETGDIWLLWAERRRSGDLPGRLLLSKAF